MEVEVKLFPAFPAGIDPGIELALRPVLMADHIGNRSPFVGMPLVGAGISVTLSAVFSTTEKSVMASMLHGFL